MTRFVRRGFARTSVLGNVHWVSEHEVDRNSWDSYQSEDVANYNAMARLRVANADGSLLSRFINPNAKCPVCGKQVYFYQNDFGSRVYFDEIGPPWPKHPCMDNENYQRPLKPVKGKATTPSLRSVGEIAALTSAFDEIDWDPVYEFGQRYGSGPWEFWVVQARFRGYKSQLLALSRADGSEGRRLIQTKNRIPKALKAGAFVFLYRRWLSMFDIGSMELFQTEVIPVRSDKSFLDLVITGQSK